MHYKDVVINCLFCYLFIFVFIEGSLRLPAITPPTQLVAVAISHVTHFDNYFPLLDEMCKR